MSEQANHTYYKFFRLGLVGNAVEINPAVGKSVTLRRVLHILFNFLICCPGAVL